MRYPVLEPSQWQKKDNQYNPTRRHDIDNMSSSRRNWFLSSTKLPDLAKIPGRLGFVTKQLIGAQLRLSRPYAGGPLTVLNKRVR